MSDYERLILHYLAVGGDRAARERLIAGNAYLVAEVINKRYSGFRDNWSLGEEMASLGYEVLCRAIDRWEPERGPMGPWCRQQIWGRISDALHLANRRLRPVSLDLTDPNSGLTLLDRIADECSSDGLAWGATRARQDLGRAYATYVDLLPPLESAIVRAVMGLGDEQEPHTLEVIGKRYGVSRQRVGKVYQRALKRLRGYKVPTDPTWPTFEAGRKEAFPVS